MGKNAVCNIPMAEKPINAPDCRLNLLSHISDVQTEVESRLESLEVLFEGNFVNVKFIVWFIASLSQKFITTKLLLEVIVISRND